MNLSCQFGTVGKVGVSTEVQPAHNRGRFRCRIHIDERDEFGVVAVFGIAVEGVVGPEGIGSGAVTQNGNCHVVAAKLIV